MKAYLVRHGEAVSKAEDHSRPLSEKGSKDVRKIARFAADRAGVKVCAIYHSGKTRAKETAEILARHLNPVNGVIEDRGLEPDAEVSLWAMWLSEGEEDVMLVGHLPHLGRLVSRLLCHDEDMEVVVLETAGIVCLEKDEAGIWTLDWAVRPEMLP